MMLGQIDNLNNDLHKIIKEEKHENEFLREQMMDLNKSKCELLQETQMTDIKVQELESHVGI